MDDLTVTLSVDKVTKGSFRYAGEHAGFALSLYLPKPLAIQLGLNGNDGEAIEMNVIVAALSKVKA